MPILSKSKYLVGLQCLKYLWILFHEPERIPEADKGTQYRFDQGKLVGELAKKLYPKGINLPVEDFEENLRRTQELLKKRKTLFEAAFLTDNIYSRADILNPVGKDEWDIIEVKSSIKVKDEHIHDLSFQKHCYEKAGLKIRKCFLMHINKEYVKKGKINPKKLFKIEDITEKANEAMQGIQERIDLMLKVISEGRPSAKIGKHCEDPYTCPLQDDCWDFLPEENVFNLYKAGNKAVELFERGILSIKDIPKNYELTDKQELQRECARTGKPYIHKEAIKHFLNSLKYPLYFLDFETFSTAIPLYDKTKPYQQIPFQFSLHVLETENSKPKHFEFLASGKEDPRKKFLSELKKVIGNKGTVLVFYQPFEASRLKELVKTYPKHKKWVQNVLDRMEDLLIPFRNFYYYHPKQNGSASIKKVMPILTGKGYEGLEINDGGNASLAFLDMTFGEASEKEKKKIRENLKKYCGRDTEGMIWIVKELRKIAR